MVTSYFISDIFGISFHIYLYEDLAVIYSHGSSFFNYIKAALPSQKSTLNAQFIIQCILILRVLSFYFLAFYRLGLIHTPEGF